MEFKKVFFIMFSTKKVENKKNRRLFGITARKSFGFHIYCYMMVNFPAHFFCYIKAPRLHSPSPVYF